MSRNVRNKNIMKKIKIVFATTFAVFCLSNVNAQVGIGTTAPTGALDIRSTNNGLLIPRVALTSTLTVLPVLTGTTSELVYNTATTGDVTPGFYYLSTPTGPWIRLGTATPVAETDPQVSSGTINQIPKWDGTTLVDGAITDTGATVGINSPTPAGALDINSTTDGMVIPRIALSGLNFASPLTLPVTSELVYNTIDNSTVLTGIALIAAGRVTPGFYFWNGTIWERFVTGALPPSTGWQTTGNTGIVDGTNFIGTAAATNIDVAFRRNNAAAGKISATSTSFGVGALTAGATTNGTAFGVNALSANTGANNTAFGTNALAANNTPADNTAVGYNALAANTLNAGAGNQNTAVGSGALDALNGGARNTAVGANALTGVNGNASLDNVAVGYNSLPGGGTIDQTVAVGSNALSGSGSNSTRSTAVGYNAGNNVAQSIENVMIGSNSQGSGSTARNQIVIGYNASANGDNQVTLGNGSIGLLRCAATVITALSDRRDKADIVQLSEGIDFINKLKPVTYTWNTRDKSKIGIKAAGFIAQDLLDVQQKSAIGENLDLVSYNNPDRLEARYGNLLPVIVKAIQEQQEQIEDLKKANADLQKMNELIVKRLEALEKK